MADRMTTMTTSERIRHFAASALALLGLAASHADARTLSPEQAPTAWVAYAQNATQTITGSLNGDEPPAPQVRAAMLGSGKAPAQPPPPLGVAIWLGRDGMLSRVDFASLGSSQVGKDLRHLLVGRHLPPPPRKMRQPMRLALHVQPRPASGATEAETTSPMLATTSTALPLTARPT